MKRGINVSILLIICCTIFLSLAGCNNKNDKVVETAKPDFLKEAYDKFDEAKYDESLQSYYKYIKNGGKAEDFTKFNDLMIQISNNLLKLDSKYKTVEELNKHSIAFGDLDDDQIPEIYKVEKLDPSTITNNISNLKAYKYDGTTFNDISNEIQPDKTSNIKGSEANIFFDYGCLTIDKVNSSKKALFNTSFGGQTLTTTIYILDKKLNQVDWFSSRTNEFPKDINGDGIINTPEASIDPESKDQSEGGANRILNWYQFDEDYKRVLSKQQFIIRDDKFNWKVVDNKPENNKEAQKSNNNSNTKVDSSNSKGTCELSDKEIIDIFKTSYNFQLNNINKDVLIDQIEKDSIFMPYKDQSIGIEERLNEYRKYFSNKYVDTNIRRVFKIKDNKVYVMGIQGAFSIDEFNSVVEKEYDSNVIKAKIAVMALGQKETPSITLVKEDGKWKVNGGNVFITD